MKRTGEMLLATITGLLCMTALARMGTGGAGVYGLSYLIGAGISAYFWGALSSYLWAPERKRTARHKWHVVVSFRVYAIVIVAGVMLVLLAA